MKGSKNAQTIVAIHKIAGAQYMRKLCVYQCLKVYD